MEHANLARQVEGQHGHGGKSCTGMARREGEPGFLERRYLAQERRLVPCQPHVLDTLIPAHR